MIEPRNQVSGVPTPYAERKAEPTYQNARQEGPSGVKEQGMHALGSHRNLGGPVVSASRRYRKTETHEVDRDGRQGVRASS